MPKITNLGHWDDLPYEDDVEAQLYVNAFRDGMSQVEIGRVMGVSHETIRRVEAKALRKLRRFRRLFAERVTPDPAASHRDVDDAMRTDGMDLPDEVAWL